MTTEAGETEVALTREVQDDVTPAGPMAPNPPTVEAVIEPDVVVVQAEPTLEADTEPPVTAPAALAAVAALPATRAAAPLDPLSAVERLRMQVASLSLTLDVDDVGEARREREGILSQLDDYLLPRLRRRDAPILAVIGGSTGAGKSTLTNSLVRREVSRSGVLRPTTRSPVLVHHPYDSGAFLSQRILPRLTRVTSEAPEPIQPIDPHAPRITGLRLVPHDGLSPGLAIIDAPDIDSLVQTNRDLAVQLLQAADLWIFVTTAARYADAMPWQMLRQAAERGAAVAVVLDRVPPEALADLRVHLATRLRDRGLGGAPLFVIPETETIDGFLPEPLVAPLQQWLRRVAGDARSRTMIADRTVKGAVASLPARAKLLASAADAQAVGWAQLRAEVDSVFTWSLERLTTSLRDGSLIRGELLARWQESMADGEFVRKLDGAAPDLLERVKDAVRLDPGAVAPLDVPVTEAVADAIRAATHGGTDEVLVRWRQYPFGATLLDTRGDQLNPVEGETSLARVVRDWRLRISTRITAAVEAAAAGEPAASIDVGTAADVLFVTVVDARPGPEAGSEITDSPTGSTEASEVSEVSKVSEPTDSVVTATLAAARRFVEGVLGAEQVTALLTLARADLVARATELLEAERRRLERLLETDDGVAGRGQALRAAADLLEGAR